MGAHKAIPQNDGTVLRWYYREALEAGTELPASEVARALYELRHAASRGFAGCAAVFLSMRFDSLHVCAVRDNPSLDWGRTDLYLRARFVDGRIVGDSDWPKPPHEWEGEREGFRCHIHINNSAARCGYVTVPVGHPAHGKDYNDLNVSVHGGLTYARDEGDGGWTLGFDCSHYGDAGHPEYERGSRHRTFDDGEYRSQEYVIAEIESLASQLKAMERSAP